jgi:hypothetical protein
VGLRCRSVGENRDLGGAIGDVKMMNGISHPTGITDEIGGQYESGKIRIRPIPMTTIATLFGLLPLAQGIGSGAKLQRPLALAVIGGLLLSTFLTLLVMPVLYSLVERKSESEWPWG